MGCFVQVEAVWPNPKGHCEVVSCHFPEVEIHDLKGLLLFHNVNWAFLQG